MGITVSVYRRRYWVKKSDGRRVKRLGKVYTIEYRTPDGKLKRVRGYEDKLASEQKAAEIRRALARGEQGLLDPFADQKGCPLSEHLDDWLADQKAKGRDDVHLSICRYRLNKLFAACGWRVLSDVTPDGFCRWRSNLPRLEDGRTKIGPRTQNQYLETLSAFCCWCVSPGRRIGENPVKDVEKVDQSTDVRRARRALTEEELVRFLAVVPAEHQRVYRFILATGLRRQEVADLQWGDVRLDAPVPFLRLRAKATKSRRADTLPLRADLAAELKALRGEAGDADPVFDDVPSMPTHRTYLEAAGIDWEDSEGRRADVHALRHTYGTLLSKSGASPREAMELMRHTDLKMTMKVYTDPRLFNLSGAVERLPIPPATNRHQAQQKKTGTDDSPVTPEGTLRVPVRVWNSHLDVTDGEPEVTERTQTLGGDTSSASADTAGSCSGLGNPPMRPGDFCPTAHRVLSRIVGFFGSAHTARRHAERCRATATDGGTRASERE